MMATDVEREFTWEPKWDEKSPQTVLDRGENPEVVNAQVAALLGSTTVAQPPEVVLPADCLVTLPGGLVIDGEVVRDAEVRELNGEDEEALAKIRVSASADPIKYTKTLLDRGVVSIGNQKATPHLLRELLIGDREALILGIRRATFGDEVEITDFYCPTCEERFNVTVSLDLIPVETLEGDREFEVPLRKGAVARVRLPNGHDQENVLSHSNLTLAEINTLWLARCVLSVEYPDGKGYQVDGSTSAAKRLGVADRQAILDEIVKRQPGPRYDEVVMVHEACEQELAVPLTVVDMFRGL